MPDTGEGKCVDLIQRSRWKTNPRYEPPMGPNGIVVATSQKMIWLVSQLVKIGLFTFQSFKPSFRQGLLTWVEYRVMLCTMEGAVLNTTAMTAMTVRNTNSAGWLFHVFHMFRSVWLTKIPMPSLNGRKELGAQIGICQNAWSSPLELTQHQYDFVVQLNNPNCTLLSGTGLPLRFLLTFEFN